MISRAFLKPIDFFFKIVLLNALKSDLYFNDELYSKLEIFGNIK